MDHRKRDSNSGDRRLASLVARICAARNRLLRNRALLVGLSGIDGSGKGYITALVENELRELGYNVASISADDWLNLPGVCINPDNPAEHFYQHALRLDEMFERLVLPLQETQHVDLVADCGDPKATIHRKHHYVFDKIEIVLLEGIFLFKPASRDHFDLKVWIDCSFETALRRAIARGQEGLPPDETRRAFETIYFPAQRIHLERDRPFDAVDLFFANDNVPRVATR